MSFCPEMVFFVIPIFDYIFNYPLQISLISSSSILLFVALLPSVLIPLKNSSMPHVLRSSNLFTRYLWLNGRKYLENVSLEKITKSGVVEWFYIRIQPEYKKKKIFWKIVVKIKYINSRCAFFFQIFWRMLKNKF